MAALELPYVNLVDALAICLLMRRKGDGSFERAAVRWLARLSLERPEITLAELRDAAAALIALPSAPRAGDTHGPGETTALARCQPFPTNHLIEPPGRGRGRWLSARFLLRNGVLSSSLYALQESDLLAANSFVSRFAGAS
jgi:hypothetical protein